MSASVLTAVPAKSRQSSYSRAADASSAPGFTQLPPPPQPARSSSPKTQHRPMPFMSTRPDFAAAPLEPGQNRPLLGGAGVIPAGDLLDRAQTAAAHPGARVHQADTQARRDRARLDVGLGLIAVGSVAVGCAHTA